MNSIAAITAFALAVAGPSSCACVEVPRLRIPVADTTWKMRDEPRPKGRWAKCVASRERHLAARKRQRNARRKQRGKR